MDRVLVFDTTLRDGEQSPGASMTPAQKLRMAHQLDTLGVDVIEAGFPISSADDFAGVREIARTIRRPIIAAMARATAIDVEAAGAALEPAERSRIHLVLGTSDIHLQHKLRISRAECLDRAAAMIEHARRYAHEVEFCAEDATRTDLGFLCEVVARAIEAGARIINLPDTVGYGHPAQVRAMFRTVRNRVPGIDSVTLSAHCHDDLGMAVANSIAAVEGGARQVECTVNGIGERAGNAALEEIVMAFHVRSDAFAYTTGVRTEELYRTSQLLTEITGIRPQPNKAIIGANAFAHEAGIHQDGILKEPTTYEIMPPHVVGVPARGMVLGKHSGRRALDFRLRQLGYSLDPEALDRVYEALKAMPDRKAVSDAELLALVGGRSESMHQRPADQPAGCQSSIRLPSGS